MAEEWRASAQSIGPCQFRSSSSGLPDSSYSPSVGDKLVAGDRQINAFSLFHLISFILSLPSPWVWEKKKAFIWGVFFLNWSSRGGDLDMNMITIVEGNVVYTVLLYTFACNAFSLLHNLVIMFFFINYKSIKTSWLQRHNKMHFYWRYFVLFVSWTVSSLALPCEGDFTNYVYICECCR